MLKHIIVKTELHQTVPCLTGHSALAAGLAHCKGCAAPHCVRTATGSGDVAAVPSLLHTARLGHPLSSSSLPNELMRVFAVLQVKTSGEAPVASLWRCYLGLRASEEFAGR